MTTSIQIDQPKPTKPRKEEILDVATRLFAEHGYDGTSMSDVAERVGMRKASLFYHFATKEALYEAVLDRLVGRVRETLEAVYSREGTYPERLEQTADVVTSVLSEWPFAARLLVREVMDWGPVIRGKLLEHILLVLERSATFVRDGQLAGSFVEGDAKQLTLSALSAQVLPFAIGQLVERYVGSDPFDPRFVESRRIAMRRQVRDMFVKRSS